MLLGDGKNENRVAALAVWGLLSTVVLRPGVLALPCAFIYIYPFHRANIYKRASRLSVSSLLPNRTYFEPFILSQKSKIEDEETVPASRSIKPCIFSFCLQYKF